MQFFRVRIFVNINHHRDSARVVRWIVSTINCSSQISGVPYSSLNNQCHCLSDLEGQNSPAAIHMGSS